MVQSHLEEHGLYGNHYERLDEEGDIELGPRVVKYAAIETRQLSILSSFWGPTHRSSDATSIMSGMSRENPALDFVRCMAYV